MCYAIGNVGPAVVFPFENRFPRQARGGRSGHVRSSLTGQCRGRSTDGSCPSNVNLNDYGGVFVQGPERCIDGTCLGRRKFGGRWNTTVNKSRYDEQSNLKYYSYGAPNGRTRPRVFPKENKKKNKKRPSIEPTSYVQRLYTRLGKTYL